MRQWLWSLACLLILSKAIFGITGVSSDFVPLQERATGESLIGANLANDSLYSNPAASAFVDTYNFDGNYDMPRTFGVSVLDTKTGMIGGGLGYFRRMYDGTNDITQGARLGLSTKVSNSFGVGVTGKMVWGPTTNVDSNGNAINDKYYGMDVGGIYNAKLFQLGATFHNVVSEDPAMDQYREFSVGGRITWQDVMYFSAASTSRFDEVRPYQYGVGAEYVSPYFFGLRGGFRIQPYAAQSYWSAGISFLSPKLALSYAIEFPTQTGNGNAIEQIFGASLQM